MIFILLALFASVIFLIIGFSVRVYNEISAPKSTCYNCLVRYTVLITGGTKGMGYAAALECAKRGARVIITSRRREEGELVRQKIVELTGNNDVIVKKLNLASFKSIWAFAYEMLNVENRLDVLINNVGVVRPNGITEDGFHPTFQINAISPFLLTILLMNLLKSTRNSRVINLTSEEGTKFHNFANAPINRDDTWLNNVRNYANSKRLLTLLMLELSEQCKMSQMKVAINFSIPRMCRTQLQLDERSLDLYRLFKKYVLFPLFYMEPSQCVENTIWCAVSSTITGKTGCFFKDCSEFAVDSNELLELRKAAWQQCWKWLKMRPEDYYYKME